MPITLPPKPWSIRRENSVNIIIDSGGNNVVMVTNAAIAEHIVERCNPTSFYLESDMEEKENEIHDLNCRLESLQNDLDYANERIEKIKNGIKTII